MLQPWAPGELFAREDGWEAEELLDAVIARLPDGVAPLGLVEMLERVDGTYTPK
jgi:hypothetical protein